MEVDFGPFLTMFWRCFAASLLRSGNKNIVKYSVFVLFACRNYIFQHGENCVNTSCLLGTGTKTLSVPWCLLPEAKNIAYKYCGFWLPRHKKHRYLRWLFAPRVSKNVKTPPIWRFSATARLRKKATGVITTTTTRTRTRTRARTRTRRTSTKMRRKDVVRWVQAEIWKKYTVLCTCAHAQSTCTTPTLTLLYITLMASPVCEALQ